MTHLLLFACLIAAPADAPYSLLLNGGFEGGRGWSVGAGTYVPRPEGGRCLRCQDGGGATQDVPVTGAAQYSVSVDIRTQAVRATGNGGYAYGAVYQLDGNGEMVAFHDFVQLTGDHAWQSYTWTLEPHPAARVISVRCGLFQAAGIADFDRWTLVPGSRPMGYDEVQQPGVGRRGQGRAAVLSVPGMPVRGAGSDPAVVARILRGAGLSVETLDDATLSDPAKLRPERYDLVVIPTGASFPAAARESWIQYLHRGGSFINLGGYAFDNLLARTEAGWVPEAVELRRRLDAAVSQENSILPDGAFEQTREAPMGGTVTDGQWRRNDPQSVISDDRPAEGGHCAKVFAPAGQEVGEVKFWCDLPAERGLYRVKARLRTLDVTGPGFAYAALYQYGDDDKLVHFRDFVQLTGNHDWTDAEYDFSPEQGAKRIHIKFGLYRATGTAWFDDFRLCRITGTQLPPLNTSNGKPGDGLIVAPSQIGAFDPSVPLRHVARLGTAAEQRISDAAVALKLPATGWVATGVMGSDNARWIPLLEARDRYGRLRGAAAALTLHYNGFYGGSMWAYWGVDSHDLFADPASPAAQMLADVARYIRRGMFLRNLKCDQPLYHAGEAVKLQVVAEAPEELPAGAAVRFSVATTDGRTVFTKVVPVSGTAPATAAADCPPAQLTGELYRVTAELLLNGKPVDSMTTGFVVDRPAVLASGPQLRFRGNRFELNGRGLFLFGTDTYSYTYQSAHEDPLTWAAEHRGCVDVGLNLYENLQFTRPDHSLPDGDQRAFLGMAQSTQRDKLVFMPGMLIGHNVVTDAAELGRQSELCAAYAELLGKTPSLLWYINGDYQLDPGAALPAVQQLWDAWLRGKYDSVGAVEEAWGAGPVKLDGERIAWPAPNNARWDDPAQVDEVEFRTWMMRRWNEAHVAGVRRHDREHPITSEYYQRPFGGIDLRLTIATQDVSNIGFFDAPVADIDNLPLRIAWNDLRSRGKGVALGEYGVKTHPAWNLDSGRMGYHAIRTEEDADQLFLAVAGYTFGMGGSKVQNWCLRDGDGWIFPWGLFYPHQMVAKDVAVTHRDISLLWRQMEPVDESPPLTVLLPSRMRLGSWGHLGDEAGGRAFGTLLGLHVPFTVADDCYLDQLPATTKAMVFPAPFALRDEDFGRLLVWVERGGMLLVTGDLSHDAMRRDTQAARLEKLCGVKLAERLVPGGQRGKQTVTDAAGRGFRPALRVVTAGADVLAGRADAALLTSYRCGSGLVLFTPDPLELGGVQDDPETLRAVYQRFLAEAGLSPLGVTPDDPLVHAFARPTRTGRLHLAFWRAMEAGHRDVALATAAGALRLGLRNRWPAAAHVGQDGRVRLVLAHREAALNGKTLLRSDGLTGVAALDGEDVRTSGLLLVTPFSQGKVVLPARTGKYTILVGDVHDGKWQTFEKAVKSGQNLSVSIDAVRKSCLVLVVKTGTEGAA
ncbi:MAG: beta-galactosidase, partial [Armatimonadetes bacterium]|nr:beta-galactosidase [Armatimonadota bacterium]